MKHPTNLMLLINFLVLLALPPCFAETKADNSAAAPDPNSFPLLAELAKSGAKFYYLGEQSGLNGWLVIKAGQMQIAYVTGDGKTTVFGAIYNDAGENVSSLQISKLAANNKEVSSFIDGLNKQQADATNTTANNSSSTGPVGEQLLKDLQSAAGVNLGSDTAPQLVVILDPYCSYCQQVWREVRDEVFKHNLQVRLIPIAVTSKGDVAANSDSERASARLLQVSNPLEAWDKFVAGDISQLAGTADAASLESVQRNHALTISWRLWAIPYLIYRAKDGVVKIVLGKPDSMAAVMSDLLH